MTVDRGGLQYRIEVVDDFSANLARFKQQLREVRQLAARSRSELSVFAQSAREARRLSRDQERTARSAARLSKEAAANRTRILRVRKAELDVAIREERLAQARLRTQRLQTSEAARAARQRQQALNREIAARRFVQRLRERQARAEARAAREAERAQARLARAERQRLNAAARAIRDRQRAERRAAIQAERAERARQRALLGRLGAVRRLLETIGRSLVVAGIFSGIFAAVEGVRGLIDAFVGFNKQLESARLGIAAIFTAVGQVTDATGAAATGARALALAQAESRRQVELLRRDALRTTATFEELAEAFQQALAPGLGAGLNVDEIRRFSVRISQAATAIGLPQNQLAEEIRSLLSGTITPRTTRIATSLGITNEDIRRAKEAGDLVGLLNRRFAAFDEAGIAASKTFEALTTNVQDALRQLIGTAGAGLFEALKRSLSDVFDLVVDQDPITGEILPDPEIVQALAAGFDALEPGLDRFVQAFKSVSPSDVEAFAKALGDIGAFALDAARGMSRLIAGLTEFAGLVADPDVNVGIGFADSLVDGAERAARAVGLLSDKTQVLTTDFSALSQASQRSEGGTRRLVRSLTEVATISARPLQNQAQALRSVEVNAQRAAGQLQIAVGRFLGPAAEAQARVLVQANAQLLQLTKERTQALQQQEAVIRRIAAAERQRTVAGLSEGDRARIDTVQTLAANQATVEARRVQAQRELNALREEERQRAAQGVVLSTQQEIAELKRVSALENQLRSLSTMSRELEKTAVLTIQQADNQDAVSAALERERTLRSQVGAAQARLNSAVRREGELRERLARTAREQAVALLGGRLGGSTQRLQALTRQTNQMRLQLQLARARTKEEREQIRATFRVEEGRRRIEQTLRIEEERLRQGVALVNERLIADGKIDATLVAQNATQREIVERLREQLELNRQVSQEAPAAQNVAAREAAQVGAQLTGAGGTFDAAGDALLAQTAEQATTLAGQIQGALVDAFIVQDGEKAKIVSSYSDVFKGIGDVVEDFARSLLQPANILRALLGGGGFGGALPSAEGEITSGFDEGGPVGSSLPRAAPLPGLSPRDVVPARLAVGEYVQPTSAVRRYGPQVMEAIRRGSIDPFALRALSGARKPVRRPRTGGFQTGGEVAGIAPAAGGGATVPAQGFIVASESQMSNLLAGSRDEMLRFLSDNADDVRSRIGV